MRDTKERLSLATAGLRLGRSRNQVERLVMIGALRGGRDDGGRWWVDADALEQYDAPVSADDRSAA